MLVKVNGEEQIFDSDPLSISELLKLSDVERPEGVSVQLNEEFVQKEDYGSTTLKENDKVDFLYFMGGGRGHYRYKEIS
jgi:sulfur carrier protein